MAASKTERECCWNVSLTFIKYCSHLNFAREKAAVVYYMTDLLYS